MEVQQEQHHKISMSVNMKKRIPNPSTPSKNLREKYFTERKGPNERLDHRRSVHGTGESRRRWRKMERKIRLRTQNNRRNQPNDEKSGT